MSEVEQLKEQLNDEKLKFQKEKFILEDELDQIKNDKVYHRRKNDFISLDKAVKREREIKHELQSYESKLFALESKIHNAEQEEKIQEQNLHRKNGQKEKQKLVKKQMADVLKYMEEGKTRSQAAQLVGIPESRIVHWCHEGDQRINKDVTDFYRKITEIEKRQEKTVQKRIGLGSTEDEIQQNIISELMDDIVLHMQNGETRKQAADTVGVKLSKVDEWYDIGSMNASTIYYPFYKDVKKIEFWQDMRSQNTDQSNLSNFKLNSISDLTISTALNENKSNSTSLVTVNYCQNCGKQLSETDSNYCSECGCSLIEVKRDDSHESTFRSRPKTSNNASAFGKCCSGLMVMFVIIAILIVII